MRLIDADLLLKEIEENYDLNYGEILINPNNFYDIVEQQPTISKMETTTWIPCSERMSEENGRYLVTYHHKSYGNYLPLFDDTYVRIMRFQNERWVFPINIDKEARSDEFKEVIAWQPLPKPYREDKEHDTI